jgi:hypothetical protein
MALRLAQRGGVTSPPAIPATASSTSSPLRSRSELFPKPGVCGTGTLLLKVLISAAQEHRLPALSLSAEIDNGARRLDHLLGFEEVYLVGGSLTMVLGL